MVCISTPLSECMQCTSLVRSAKNVGTGETNHYSELCNTKNKNGEDVFRTIRVGLVCDACREAGLDDFDIKINNWNSITKEEDTNVLTKGKETIPNVLTKCQYFAGLVLDKKTFKKFSSEDQEILYNVLKNKDPLEDPTGCKTKSWTSFSYMFSLWKLKHDNYVYLENEKVWHGVTVESITTNDQLHRILTAEYNEYDGDVVMA